MSTKPGQVHGAVLSQADLNAGMSALVANQEGRQETLQSEGRHADADDSRVPASQGAGARAERLGVRQELATASQEVFTFARQHEAPAPTIE